MKKMLERTGIFLSAVCGLVSLFALDAFARAGGGGGGHSSSHSSGSGHSGGGSFSGSSHYGSSGGDSGISFGAVLVIIIIIVVVIFVLNSRRKKNFSDRLSTLQEKPVEKASGCIDFLKNNPDFDVNDFYAKVKKAFTDVQIAWGNGSMQSVRRFISDGVYQRFYVQLKMMGILKQKDVITDIKVSGAYIDRCETDGIYDILHVAISAGMSDQFVCDTMPELNSPGGYESFTEYWSFVRKRGKVKKDIYSGNNCPNCSAALPADMGDAGRCPYCGTFVNSGEYDWVLSEITQRDDYLYSAFAARKTPDLSDRVKALIGESADFAVEEIEDKASNGYLQILTALALNDPAIMRRFVTDAAFAKLSGLLNRENIYYNRLYLNDVSLIGIRQESEKNILSIGIKSTYQRVRLLSENEAELIDPVLLTKNEVVVMERTRQTEASKGSLYAHICSTCGGPLKDSIDVKCPYCGATLNSSKNEWIISDILSGAEYTEYSSQNAKTFLYKADPALTDDLATVKDFAFNNMMILMACDGVFAYEEKKIAIELAKKWGFKYENIQPLFDMAASGRLVIRMPEDEAKKKKIFALMNTAANADGQISQQESKLLEHVKATYAIAD